MTNADDIEVELALGRTLSVVRDDGGAVVRIAAEGGRPELELRIAVTSNGPVICARAHAISIEAEDTVTTRCRRFRVEADDAIELVAERTIVQHAGLEARIEAGAIDLHATIGDARVRANDDVQLLGEQVLLNCDREPPLPPWVPGAPKEEALLPAEDCTGDAALLADLKGQG